jgi:hypothetical protein
MMMMGEKQSSLSQVHATRFWVLVNPCSELSLSRPNLPTKEGEGDTPHTNHVMRVREEDKDGQRGHTVGPSWVLYLPAGYSITEQGL